MIDEEKYEYFVIQEYLKKKNFSKTLLNFLEEIKEKNSDYNEENFSYSKENKSNETILTQLIRKNNNEKKCTHINDINIISPYLISQELKLKCKTCIIKLKIFNFGVSSGENYCSKCLNSHINKEKDEKKKHNIFITLNFNQMTLKINCESCKSLILDNKNNKLNELLQYINEIYFNKYQCNIFTEKEISEKKYKIFLNLLNEKFKKIIFMVGAGISTTAGIPDFRSQTGLFKQLQEKYSLNSPEEFFNISTFKTNPIYFYEFTKYFDLSKTKPTLTHKFMNYLIKQKNNVKYLFTQNIDGLEIKAKIPSNKIIFAHGNFLDGHCSKCKKNIDIKLINKGIEELKIVYCDKCNSPCKPNIVFYGEDLPKRFYEKLEDLKDVDCCIILGTSLKVFPFANIPNLLNKNAWVICINKEKIGDFNYKYLSSRSLMLEGDTTDNFLKKILRDIKWKEDFKKFCLTEYGDENIYKEEKNEMISVEDSYKNKKDEENKSENEDEETLVSKEDLNNINN